jgi:hypothetical protein
VRKACLLLAGALLSCLLLGCEQQPSRYGLMLAGAHKLRKMQERENDRMSFGGFFVFGVGAVGGRGETVTMIKFAWQTPDGIYAISSMPIEKIMVRISETAEVPTIEFYHPGYTRIGSSCNSMELQEVIDNRIGYAVITCREQDWPTDVQLPLNREAK